MAMRKLFRGIQAQQPSERDFWSNKRLGNRPRGIERTDEREYDSLSMWETRELLEPWCVKYPQIGSHIAELELPDEPGGPFAMEPSGQEGHWSVWGEPAAFLPSIRRIYRVGEARPVWEAPTTPGTPLTPGASATQ
jgi:hypothetical protein